jgi:hypothetical protein
MSYRDLDCDWTPGGKKPPIGFKLPGTPTTWTGKPLPPGEDWAGISGTGIAHGILDTFIPTSLNFEGV